MTRRTDTAPERTRRAHADRLDPETADRVMNREYRTVTPRQRDAYVWDRHPVAEPAAVERLAGELARDAVMPDALAVACAEHDAVPGVYCYRGARGICAARLERRQRHA